MEHTDTRFSQFTNEVLAALRAADRPLSFFEIADLLGDSTYQGPTYRRVNVTVRRLVERGLVEKKFRGVYQAKPQEMSLEAS